MTLDSLMRAGIVAAVALVSLLMTVSAGAAQPDPPQTCFRTGGGDLTVCHADSAEGIYGQPSPLQIEYNTQIMKLDDHRYAVVLHSEAEDFQRYLAQTGQPRPGDSIKTGIQETKGDPSAALRLPSKLAFRIWGTLTNRQSPLFYAYQGPAFPATGLSGGANPMVTSGLSQAGERIFYVFFLGVTSDKGRGKAFRNVLLEARTKDFIAFDVLQRDAGHHSVWVPFAGEQAQPAIVTDEAGHPLQSNQAAEPEPAGSNNPTRPPGAVITAGLFGSVVRVHGLYYYFYTDQDPDDRTRNHLYLRTTKDIGSDGQWSAPSIVTDVPPEVIVRVAKARGMDRWAVIYSCLKSAHPFRSDLCLQYTRDLSVSGPRGIAGLTLFQTPYNGVSGFALGLLGREATAAGQVQLRAQHFYMTDPDGNLAAPAGAPPSVGGVLTWLELPIDLHILGAPTFWADWTVAPR
ncbi:hypothetical protein ACELLULO517_24165 [Acidisoma cellulosilytica]|uniref:Uncharacterized protein n=1 Tax=Acidisoma cellulosilyticum TaxID=2802395 RepID=A0A964E655_9PROT|nr:hypothetical protein [Acidisoma cellulosilyticum]MCB8883365.1 hypothetical protein [Acidisoma cellulosilyticum]